MMGLLLHSAGFFKSLTKVGTRRRARHRSNSFGYHHCSYKPFKAMGIIATNKDFGPNGCENQENTKPETETQVKFM